MGVRMVVIGVRIASNTIAELSFKMLWYTPKPQSPGPSLILKGPMYRYSRM